MKIFVKPFLIAALLTLLVATDFLKMEESAALENDSNRNIRSIIEELFSSTNEMTFKFVPLTIERSFLISENFELLEDWRYRISYRCPSGSCAMVNSPMQDHFSGGTELRDLCPLPYRFALEFSGSGGVIYIQESGKCFTVHDRSYVTEQTFFEIVPLADMHPGIFR